MNRNDTGPAPRALHVQPLSQTQAQTQTPSQAPAQPPAQALIVTAQLPHGLFSRLEGLRRAHYPPARNHVPAHVTLFHALPPSSLGEVRGLLARAARGAPPAAQTRGVFDMGRGTGIAIASPALADLREELGHALHGLLSAQDQGTLRFHVTVQAKVDRAEARALQAQLRAGWRDEAFAFPALALHRLAPRPGGGAGWDTLGEWPFRGHR